MVPRAADRRHLVQGYFDSTARYWRDLYLEEDLNAALYRQREDAALGLAAGLKLDGSRRVLEIGCGAGRVSMDLAAQGLTVHALDLSPKMVEAVRRQAEERGISDRIRAQSGDVHHLPFAGESFDLVMAIGVLEWTPTLDLPLAEMCRVLKPGGHLVVNIDNAWALHCWLDPLRNPFLAGAKETVRSWMEVAGWRRPEARPNRRHRQCLDRALRRAGLVLQHHSTGGFGPYSFLGRRLLTHALAVELHYWLQRQADARWPLIRWGGETYLTLSQKGKGGQ